MDALKILTKITIMLLVGAALSSCASHQAVPGAYSTPNSVPVIAGGGAVAGAAVGATMHPSAIPIGAAIGGVAAGTVGLISERPSAILSRIAHQGVQVVGIGDSLKFIIFTDKCFEFGTSDLTNQCANTLSYIAAFLKKTGNAPVNVAGYTDDVLTDAVALRLSQAQADSIVAYLWAHGIPQQRFYVKGYGSVDPIATNYTTHGKGLNRRVEISLD